MSIQGTPPLRITYENYSEGILRNTTWIECEFQDQEFGGFAFRVVAQQNVPINIGMDWMLKSQVLIDPLYKKLIPRSCLKVDDKPKLISNSNNTNIPHEIETILLLRPVIQ